MKSNELFRILENDGWFEIRQTGSHIIMKHPTKKKIIVVPFHSGKEVKMGILKSILKDAEIKTKKR
jgi:predicted RNA binding protein YcfA (HicA-like mRNA interferase family)